MQGLLTCGHILLSWCDLLCSCFSSLKRIAGGRERERERPSFYPFVPLPHCPSPSLWVNQFPSQTCGTNFATAQTPLVTFRGDLQHSQTPKWWNGTTKHPRLSSAAPTADPAPQWIYVRQCFPSSFISVLRFYLFCMKEGGKNPSDRD